MRKPYLLPLLGFILLLLNACDLYSQRPEDSFLSKHFPALLEMLANPRPTPAHEIEILERIRQDKTRQDLLRVAVIDGGTDYLHPALVEKIDFQVADGRIVGAGWDFMGGDAWPHPNLVNPTLFAFGAQKVTKSGKIVAPQEDPIAYYDSLNEAFVSRFLGKLRADSFLKNTLFAKLSPNSFTLSGAAFMLLQRKQFPMKEYRELGDLGKWWDKDARSNKKLSWKSEYLRRKARAVLDQEWRMGQEIGLPLLVGGESAFCRDLTSFRGADRFYSLLRREFEAFSNESGFDSALKAFADFVRMRSQEDDHVETEFLKARLIELHSAWFKNKFGYVNSDPLMGFVADLRENMSVEDLVYIDSLAPEAQAAYGEKLLKAWLDKIEASYKIILKEKLFSKRRLHEVAKTLESFPKFRSEITTYFAERGFELLVEGHDFQARKGHEPYSKNGAHHWNPYFDEGSFSASHGTHTASTILAQSPGDHLRIYPLRVMISSVSHAEVAIDRQAKKMAEDFRQWLSLPLVQEALLNDVWENSLHRKGEVLPTGKQRETLIEETISELMAFQSLNHSIFRMQYEFFTELVQAIQKVGGERIKMTNISLGLDFQDLMDDSLGDGDDDEEYEEDEASEEAYYSRLGRFVGFEYYKYRLAEAMQEYAPKTLFFVAAGNETRWLDGKSQSSLPNDLSSPWLGRFESVELGFAPNNKTRNIVSVMSLNNRGDLSPFTNLPIVEGIPVVGALGESVRAAVKMDDPMSGEQHFIKSHRRPITSFPLDSEDDLVREIAEELGFIDPSSYKDERALESAFSSAVAKMQFFLSSFMREAYDILLEKHVLEHKYSDAEMSGTSMATPNVLGFAAELTVRKMQKLGLRDAEIYEHPEFSPEKLTELLVKALSPFGGTSIIRDLPVLREPLKYQPVRNEGHCAGYLNLASKA